MREFEYDELQKATNNFSITQIIGKGSHGCIYKGTLENGQVIAIKRTSLGLQNLKDNTKLENEAHILSLLPQTQTIINLLGITSQDSVRSTRHNKVSTSSSVQMLVMEFMPNGSLHDLLHSNTHLSILLTWEKRIQIALQVAKAMQFLHALKPKVIHRDIKSTNILLDKDLNPKLIDFGLAIRVQVINSLSQPAGTIGYLDPCYTTPCKLSTKNDVFSFGVVLLEIICGQKVVDASRSTTTLVEWVLPLVKEGKFGRLFDRRKAVPRFIEGVLMQVLGVAIRCVSFNVDDRPTSDEIVSEMENVYCYLERMKFPIWVKFLRGFVVLKRRGNYDGMMSKKQRANNVANIKCVACHQRGVFQHNNNEVTRGKLLLRDILSDIVYE